MNRTKAPQQQQELQQQQLPSPENNNNNTPGESEKRSVPKKPSKDFTERISQTAAALERHIDEHERSRIEAQEKIEKAYNALREAADDLEKCLSNALQEGYAEEEARLQESLEKLNMLSEKNDARKKEGSAISDEEIEKELKEVESVLCGVQRYEVKVPKCNDLKEWASGILDSEFKVNVGQSLSEKFLKKRTFRVTGVNEVNPNEVHIGISFLNAEEEAAMRRMKLWSGVEYAVEMWNGEEGNKNRIVTKQILGPSHNCYVEWRFRRGSVCKIRVCAAWRGLLGEERQSGWSEWIAFTVPGSHKDSGIFRTCVVWAKREDGETYTVTDTTTGDVLYNGMKPYTRIPYSLQGHEILIRGSKEWKGWEERRTVEKVPENSGNLIDDLRIFHTDGGVCMRALSELEIKVNSILKHLLF